MKGKLKEIYSSRYILWEMVKRNVKNQYRNSVLGIFWTILNPLLYMFVLSIVFSQIFKNNIECYPVYLLTGTIIFDLMRNSTSTALTSLVDNSGLLTKVKLPYYVFPTSIVISNLVNFGFALIAMVIVMLCYSFPFSVTLLMIVPYLPSILMFSIGMSFILATLYVFFRDIKHIYSVVVTLWMYLTPLFYTVLDLPAKFQPIMKLNPMYFFVSFFRDITYYQTLPSWQTALGAYAFGFGFLLLGVLIFKWKRKKFILYI